jgi:hypothetical protein
MNKEQSQALHNALSIAIREGVAKYGLKILLGFSDRKRKVDTK